MGLANTLTLESIITGVGFSQTFYQQLAQPAGQTPNCPPPGASQLQIGNNTILVPSGFTIQGVWVFAPVGSTNIKIFKGVTGDTGFTSLWGAILGVASGGQFVINSAAIEVVSLIWF
jgi:hypothetical protein